MILKKTAFKCCLFFKVSTIYLKTEKENEMFRIFKNEDWLKGSLNPDHVLVRILKKNDYDFGEQKINFEKFVPLFEIVAVGEEAAKKDERLIPGDLCLPISDLFLTFTDSGYYVIEHHNVIVVWKKEIFLTEGK